LKPKQDRSGLPLIIERLKKKGYKFVTLEELLNTYDRSKHKNQLKYALLRISAPLLLTVLSSCLMLAMYPQNRSGIHELTKSDGTITGRPSP
jgi:hypothetical protein